MLTISDDPAISNMPQITIPVQMLCRELDMIWQLLQFALNYQLSMFRWCGQLAVMLQRAVVSGLLQG